MNRREFITLLGGAAVAWPLAARAKQVGKVARIGYLSPGSTSPGPLAYHDEFQRGLHELGYVEGRNIVIEYRFADGKFDRLPAILWGRDSSQVLRDRVYVAMFCGRKATLKSNSTISLTAARKARHSQNWGDKFADRSESRSSTAPKHRATKGATGWGEGETPWLPPCVLWSKACQIARPFTIDRSARRRSLP
jgi:hypothetical protein